MAIVCGLGGSAIVCGICDMYVVMASCKRGCRHPDDAMRPAAQGGMRSICMRERMLENVDVDKDHADRCWCGCGDGDRGGCIGSCPGDVRGVDIYRKTVVAFPE